MKIAKKRTRNEQKKLFRVRTEQDGAFVLKALNVGDLANSLTDKVSILNAYPTEKIEAICLEFSEQIFVFCSYTSCLAINVEHIARIIAEWEKMWAYSKLLSYLEENKEYFVSIGMTYEKGINRAYYLK